MSQTENEYSPREIYQVFSRNLRELVARAPSSVTQICREIGVNRTQFNRYLAGQASPRPDILHKICVYFQVDARILLEPLADLEDVFNAQGIPWITNAAFRQHVVSSQDRLTLSLPVPLGIHRYWQRSSLHPDWVNSFTMRIYKLDRATVFRALSDPGNDKILTRHDVRSGREFKGIFLAQVDGVTMLSFQEDSLRIGMGYLTRLTSDSPILSGITLASQPELLQATRIERCVLEFLPQKRGLLERLRGRGGRALADLPEHIAHGLRGDVR
ncbi:helix-turn-helix transcriptional regulator [Aliiroseovarius crassostreae]|uniref:helix-turn-helix domain-containing protein n=1 Tax=Aliiroseovarius crassostreae TaxID=154981 RepID=UPI0021FD1D9E|nr:helix-turn-helix transcriptional regulator [Aliiroseovarius crassostreae]UWP93535.1 helix-turn-helix transcriptional regulator [Aliiroseovarius crassostreae]